MIESLMLRLTPYKLLFQIGAALLVAAAGFGSGWLINGWRLRSELSDLKAEQAEGKAEQATAVMTTLKADAAAIHLAATEYTGIKDTLAPKIAALTKELRNAKPLPPDCAPTPDRVRNLDTAIDAANQVIPR